MSAFDSDKYHRKWWLSLPRMRVTMAEALALPEYSATNPTGVRPGKTWRRHDGAFDHEARARGLRPRWVICTYEAIPGDDTRVRNGRYRAVIRVPMGRRVGPCTYPTCDCGVYMPDSILEGEQRALCPRDISDVAWSTEPFRPAGALVDGKLLTWDPVGGVLRDDDGNAYTLVMT